MSAIGSINSNTSVATQANPRAPEASEVKSARDKDGDSDDAKTTKAAAPAPAPTVNTSGQKIGQLINDSA
jgi:hypothetical protein